ncbi:MFS transporter [Acidobacterium sp. S8]|uniref:MFS transporter n=1 Tax=Acidobacterium sp. S8 TaxID=1641854 RepID=UPI00131A6E40|nr:MFS transporter [Acidobacterium sp. S8]
MPSFDQIGATRREYVLTSGRGSLWLTFAVLWGVRFGLGLSEATTFPVGNRVIRNWMPSSERARAGSIMFMGTCTASAITGPLVPWLISRMGWQLSFVVGALPALIAAIVWYCWFRDLPDEHPSVNAGELALIHIEEVNKVAEPSPAAPLPKLLRDRNVLLLTLSYTSEGYVLFIFVFWLYIYLVEQRHFSMIRGGWMAALPWLTALVLTPFGGALCDFVASRRGRLQGARVVLVSGYGVTGATLFLAAYSGSAYVSVAALALSIAFLMASEAGFWSAATHLAGGQVGVLSGVMNTAGIAGGILSTFLVPVLVEHFGWLAALGSGAFMSFGCVLAWLAIREAKPALPVHVTMADSERR